LLRWLPAAVEERIAAWTLLPAGNGEGMQVLRYGNAEKYDAHWVSVARTEQ
jgi:prolyl 4-hydroxylase